MKNCGIKDDGLKGVGFKKTDKNTPIGNPRIWVLSLITGDTCKRLVNMVFNSIA